MQNLIYLPLFLHVMHCTRLALCGNRDREVESMFLYKQKPAFNRPSFPQKPIYAELPQGYGLQEENRALGTPILVAMRRVLN